MEPSPKSQLNLLCQKNPALYGHIVYKTAQDGGQPHSPIFKSEVVFLGKKFSGKGSSKRSAEELVARAVLESIAEKKKKPIVRVPKPPVVQDAPARVVFVDLENIPEAGDLVQKNPKTVFIAFFSTISPLARKLEEQRTVFNEVHTTSHTGKNAADTLLIFHFCKMLFEGKLKDKRAIILSRDSFSSALAEVAKENASVNVTVIHHSSLFPQE